MKKVNLITAIIVSATCTFTFTTTIFARLDHCDPVKISAICVKGDQGQYQILDNVNDRQLSYVVSHEIPPRECIFPKGDLDKITMDLNKSSQKCEYIFYPYKYTIDTDENSKTGYTPSVRGYGYDAKTNDYTFICEDKCKIVTQEMINKMVKLTPIQ